MLNYKNIYSYYDFLEGVATVVAVAIHFHILLQIMLSTQVATGQVLESCIYLMWTAATIYIGYCPHL